MNKTLHHGLINYIDIKAKCRHLKKLTWERTLREVFYFSEAPPLLGFCFGWSSNFVGSECGQILSVEPVEPERRLEGQQFKKLGRKYQHG